MNREDWLNDCIQHGTAKRMKRASAKQNSSEKIFSGDRSVAFWDAIGKVKPKVLFYLLYDFGCRCQALEARVARLEAK